MLRRPIEPNQYTSISFAETLALDGIAASIGSVGGAYDNALAESTIGLFKTEAVSKSSPFLQGAIKTIDDIEFATMEWVDWFNTRRLHSTLGYVTPDEFEATYLLSTIASPAGDVASIGAARNPARFRVDLAAGAEQITFHLGTVAPLERSLVPLGVYFPL